MQTSRVSGAIVRKAESAIIAGCVSVGEGLPPEHEPAEQLAVSRVAVRDALRVLEARGLIRERGGEGWDVRDGAPVLRNGLAHLLIPSGVTAGNVTELRLAWEVVAVRLASSLGSAPSYDEDIDELLRTCTRMESALDSGDYDIRSSAQCDVGLCEP